MTRARRTLLAIGLCFRMSGSGAAEEKTALLRIGPVEVLRKTPSLLTLGAGVFDLAEEGDEVFDRKGRSAAGKVEYQFGSLPIAPTFGLIANRDGGVYGYGGLSIDLAIDRWRISPLLTAGGYRQGHSKIIGGPFEFQVGGSFAYELESGTRAGITFAHISNAYLYEKDAGAELLFLSYALPLPDAF